jgi:hypothetical protein
MKKVVIFIIVLAALGASFYLVRPYFAPPEVLIDSFEGPLDAQTVDYGASENSQVAVHAYKTLKVCGEQSLKIEYNLKPSGYMWVARGYGLDVAGAGRWEIEPEKIFWKRYNAFSVSMRGRNAGGVIAFDIKDAGGEMWRFLLADDFEGWKEIVCPFEQFFLRGDWQPEDARKDEVLDFPIKSFQFEPRLPGTGVYYFDCVKLKRTKK